MRSDGGMAPSSPRLPPELVEFLESGVSIVVGTRDAHNRPAVQRVVGVRVGDDLRSFILYVPDATGERTIANARATQRIAATFCRPVDYRSLQLKGRVTEVRPTREDERENVERYIHGFGGQVEVVGLPRSLTRRLTYWPNTAVVVAIDDVFIQTPGPAAGNRFEGNA